MVRAGLGYLAAADATQLSAATQAECLRELEQADAIATAARAFIQAGFTAGQGYADDAAYSARAWLIHQTHITRGAAVGHAAWARRAVTHPTVLAALAAGQVSESAGRLICLWTDRLPEHLRDRVGRAAGRGRGGRAGAGGAGRAGRADVRTVPRRSPGPGPGPGLRRPRPQARDYLRRRRRHPRGPDPGVRRDRRAGAGRAGRQGRPGRRPDPGPAVPRRAAGSDEAAGGLQLAAGAGRAAGESLGAHLAGGPAAARRRLRVAGAVDRADPGAVGRVPGVRLRDRQRGRRMAGWRRRRGRSRATRRWPRS